jgi:hypothetical protein
MTARFGHCWFRPCTGDVNNTNPSSILYIFIPSLIPNIHDPLAAAGLCPARPSIPSLEIVPSFKDKKTPYHYFEGPDYELCVRK